MLVEMRISDIEVPGASFEKDIKEISRSYRRLLTQLRAVDFETLAVDEQLIEGLRTVADLINEKLEQSMLAEARNGN